MPTMQSSVTILLQHYVEIEWEPNYVPRQMHTPGIGLSDFVDDVGQIVKNRSGRRKGRRITRRKKRGGDNAGLYHTPGTSSIVSSQCDGFSNPAGDVRVEPFNDDFESSDYDSSTNDNANQFIVDDNDDQKNNSRVMTSSSPSYASANRERLHSGGTGYSQDKEVTDDDLEML